MICMSADWIHFSRRDVFASQMDRNLVALVSDAVHPSCSGASVVLVAEGALRSSRTRSTSPKNKERAPDQAYFETVWRWLKELACATITNRQAMRLFAFETGSVARLFRKQA